MAKTPEDYVTETITVICYEKNKPRVITPDHFTIYDSSIKYKHVKKNKDNEYELIIPDMPVKIFDKIHKLYILSYKYNHEI